MFERLIRNGWKESRDREVVLDDIDEDTFVRFCQFIYCGDYSVPSLVSVVEPCTSLGRSPRQDDAKPDCGPKSRPVIEKPCPGEAQDQSVSALPRISEQLAIHCCQVDRKGPLLETFRRRCKGFFHSQNQVAGITSTQTTSIPPDSKLARLRLEFHKAARPDGTFKPPYNTHPQQSLSQILLCHARLYIFSDRYDCAVLRTLILARLRLTLAAFQIFKERVEDFLSLVTYVYETTTDKDEIRGVLVDFGLCIVPALAEHPLWKGFYDTTPEYCRDLHSKMKQALGLLR